ncbi:UbiX family flavin prenyltransferase [Helicovermis profundi]|uniref:Flavin prenyltransferase UbiX n=1 Tax=Helicovermis profundi TaxID=3065157 RepID=A0AAU9EEW0_9FIRM|nr:UbiX family flavin prenyltransferase [Clostridia bacterium S502]
MKKIIVAITGGSCVIYAVALLKTLQQMNIETHVVVSKMGESNLNYECDMNIGEIKEISSYYYDYNNLGAAIASGSFKIDSMVIIPCTMNTLGAIANGLSSNLIHRAADVTIKEGRKLVIVPRETPFSPVHLENMLKLSKIGVTIMPAAPGFYHIPETISDIVDIMVGRTLDQLGIDSELFKRWE